MTKNEAKNPRWNNDIYISIRRMREKLSWVSKVLRLQDYAFKFFVPDP